MGAGAAIDGLRRCGIADSQERARTRRGGAESSLSGAAWHQGPAFAFSIAYSSRSLSGRRAGRATAGTGGGPQRRRAGRGRARALPPGAQGPNLDEVDANRVPGTYRLEEVRCWRYNYACRLGFDEPEAALIAHRAEIDTHVFERLIRRGLLALSGVGDRSVSSAHLPAVIRRLLTDYP
jgi:hypothetical protein